MDTHIHATLQAQDIAILNTWIDQQICYPTRRVQMKCPECHAVHVKTFRQVKEEGALCATCLHTEKHRTLFQAALPKIQQYFLQFGSTFLTTKQEPRWPNSKDTRSNRLYYRCRCGAESSKFVEQFTSGVGIPLCQRCSYSWKDDRPRLDLGYRKAQAFTQAELDRHFQDYGATLLEPYVNLKTPLRFRCVCGELAQYQFSHAKSGRLTTPARCSSCQGEYSRIRSTDSSYRKSRSKDDFDYRWYFLTLQKFGYTCPISGERTKLSAHHIHLYYKHPSLREHPHNGFCMARHLHREFHSRTPLKEANYHSLAAFYQEKTGRVLSQDYPDLLQEPI